jgi:hypothetical protein
VDPPDPGYAAREHSIAAVAGALTVTGRRIDQELLAERHASRTARVDELRARLIGDYGFPPLEGTGRPSRSPWATKAGARVFLDLLGTSTGRDTPTVAPSSPPSSYSAASRTGREPPWRRSAR